METQTAESVRRPITWRWGIYLAIGLLLVGWLLGTPAGLLGKGDALGYAVCHRIDERSLHLGERQLPLCARCTGMYLGAILALGFQFWTGNKRMGMPNKWLWLPLAAAFLAFGLDGVNSFATLLNQQAQGMLHVPTLYEPQNWLRLLTGTGMGLLIGAALYPVFHQTVWLQADPRRALDGWRSFGLLVLLAGLVDLMAWSENPFFIYPLALISAAGVVLLLGLIYTMLWLMVLRQDGRITTWRSLVFYLALGGGTALAQVAAIDFVRFWLTHTWGAFPFS